MPASSTFPSFSDAYLSHAQAAEQKKWRQLAEKKLKNIEKDRHEGRLKYGEARKVGPSHGPNGDEQLRRAETVMFCDFFSAVFKEVRQYEKKETYK